MKKIVTLLLAMIFIFSFTTLSMAEKKESICEKCHRGEKAIDKIIAKKDIKSADALVKTVRESAKAKMHEKRTDNEIKAAFEDFNPEKK